MKKFMKALTVVFCAAILVAGSITATLAYLATKTDPVENTFTAGNISITLTKTGNDEDFSLKMVPGVDVNLNPTVVTVLNGSEACWLFVKIEKLNNFDDFMEPYAVADGWTKLTLDASEASQYDVYYRQVDYVNAEGGAEGKSFSIIAGDKVTAKAECTKDDYNLLGQNQPELNFTAYAVQLAGFGTAEAAWVEARDLS